MELITSRNNPKVKEARILRQTKRRKASGAFVVEGIRHVGEAVEAREAGVFHGKIEYLLYAPDRLTSAYAHDLIARQIEHGIPCYAVSADVFESVAEKDNPQGLLAVMHAAERSLEELKPQNFPWGVALVDPQDPGNLGTILRTVDAVGASGVLLLDGSVDPYHPSAVRASMGTMFWHPLAPATFEQFTTWAKRHAYHVYGTSAHDAVDYREVGEYSRPAILLLGSERAGLNPEQAAICELLIRLPMKGKATSLNLGVAAGVMLYQMLDKP